MKQAWKPRSHASLKLWSTHFLADRGRQGVELWSVAPSLAKNCLVQSAFQNLISAKGEKLWLQ